MEPSAVSLKYPFLSEQLRQLGYATHMIGKWHLGYCRREYLPTSRGFDSFYGFYGAQGGYFNHTACKLLILNVMDKNVNLLQLCLMGVNR